MGWTIGSLLRGKDATEAFLGGTLMGCPVVWAPAGVAAQRKSYHKSRRLCTCDVLWNLHRAGGSATEGAVLCALLAAVMSFVS